MKVAKHPAEVVERVRQLRRRGVRTREIAETCGLPRATVATMIAGLPSPPRRDGISAETIKVIRALYRDGETLNSISKAVRVSLFTVRRAVEDLATLRAVPVAEIRKRYQRGDSVNAIARDLGVARQTVRQNVRDLAQEREVARSISTTVAKAAKVDTIRALYTAGSPWREIVAVTGAKRKEISACVRDLPRRLPARRPASDGGEIAS